MTRDDGGEHAAYVLKLMGNEAAALILLHLEDSASVLSSMG